MGKRPPQVAASTKPNDGKQSLKDLQDDPLPPDALVRLGTIRLRHGDNVRNVGFFPNGKTLISADWHAVHVWDATTGRRLRRFGDPRDQQFQDIAFSQDGQTVALAMNVQAVGLAMSEGEIDIWDAAQGDRLRQFRVGRFPSLQFSPDAKLLAVLDQDAKDKLSLRLLDATTGEELHRLTGHQDSIHRFLFSPDGKTLISCSDDKSVRFWEVATGKQVRQFDFAEPVGHIAISPDGKTLASVATKKTTSPNTTTWMSAEYVALWDVEKGKETFRLKGHENGVIAMAFAPDCKTLVSSDWKSMHSWDLATGKELPGKFSARRVFTMAFATDGKILATGGVDHTVRLWDASTGTEKLTRKGHQDAVDAVAVSPDGRTVATGGYDDIIIRLWDASTGEERRKLIGPEKGTSSLLFAPGGRALFSSGPDETVRVWETSTGKELRSLPGKCMALSPDGKMLANGCGKQPPAKNSSIGRSLGTA